MHIVNYPFVLFPFWARAGPGTADPAAPAPSASSAVAAAAERHGVA